MRRVPLPCLALLLALVAVPGAARAQTFVFHLRGDQEVPPVPSAASGGCMGVLDQGAGTFDLTCTHNVVGATLMHVHRAPAGANGPVVFDLGDPTSPVTATWTGMTMADVEDLLDGDLYINVHTAGRPDGEIRGQVLPRTVDTVNFTADGAQMVPPNATAATATCVADLNDPATSLAVDCTHDVASPSAAHVHSAPAGVNGSVVFTFPSPASPLSAGVPVTPQLVADFAATFLYVEIHSPGTEEDPGDEIRGQVGTPPAPPTTGTVRIVKRTFPPGGTGFGFTGDVSGGPAAFTLDDGQTEEFPSVPAGSYTVTEDDPSATPGGFALSDVACDDTDSAGDPFFRAASIALQAAEVVTCTFTNVAVGGADELFVFHLRGDQEVPPVGSAASGGCMGQLDSVAGELTLVCVHDVASPTLMHVHRAPPGANGPVVFDLGNPTSPVHATWSGMTPDDVDDLLDGNLYVNVHTAGRPDGEIRGQVLERTVDVVAFTADGSQMVPPNVETAATADCTADLDAPATGLAVQCTHDVPSPTAAHLHVAPAGQNGPVAYTFASPASPLSETAPMTPLLVASFAATFLYLEIHTATSEDDPGDEVRGQVGTPPAAPATGTIRIRKHTLPAGGAGFGFTGDVPGGPAAFALDDGQTQEFTAVPPGTYTVTEDDPAGSPGGHSTSDVACDDADSTGDPFARAATVRVEAGELVTCTFTNLAVLAGGQLFVFHLAGAQEVPAVPSPASGGCFARLDAAAGELVLVCVHDVVGPTLMHVHRAPAGANGPVVFDLGNPASPVEAVWSGMTPADVADLLAGNLYLNVHTGGRPEGEIRGQLLPRTVDQVGFALGGGQVVPPTDSPAGGFCSADLDDAAASLFVQCAHNVAAPLAAHLHAAPPGQNGPAVFSFDPASPFAAGVPMSPLLVAHFAAGFLYVDVHSASFPEGEVRGQIGEGAAPIAIPTLGEWAALLFAMALASLALRRLRREPAGAP